MRQQAPPARLRVPASTSNLGPGFDLLGLALALPLEIELLGTGPRGVLEIERAEGEAAVWPRTGNLLLVALERGLERLAVDPVGLAVRVRSEIPLARGLGSSGAAIAAGLLFAEHLAGRSLPREELARIGAMIEGHPDNVTASLLGGCTLAIPDGKRLLVVRQEVHATVGVAVAWPERRVATREARAVLPSEVPLADAVENARRLVLLLAGLREGDGERIALGLVDRLHVPHRLPLVPGAEAAFTAACEAGAFGATLSGSGSALVALAPRAACAEVARAMCEALTAAGEKAHGRATEIERDAPFVESA